MELLKGEERIGGRRVLEKEAPSHLINRKADKKLQYVAGLYELAMGEKWTESRTSFLEKRLQCRGFRFLSYLDLKYTYENRFWAFSYNLNMRTTINVSERKHEEQSCRFVIKTKGKMAITEVAFIDGGSECEEEISDIFLKKLNNPLILDRIVSLDIADLEVRYNPANCHWSITLKSLIGSATWILIPPVMHLIKPAPVECVRMLELFELIGNAVAGKNSPAMRSKK